MTLENFIILFRSKEETTKGKCSIAAFKLTKQAKNITGSIKLEICNSRSAV